MKQIFLLLLVVTISTALSIDSKNYHNKDKCERFLDLPTATSNFFSGSGNCASCHRSNGTVLTINGEDVAPPTHWRSTMMANAAKDPLWRAKVSAEIFENPQLQTTIETKCTTCHAPLAHREAFMNGATEYSISEMVNDELAMDGVSCTLCHQVQPDNFGSHESFSGHFSIDQSKTIFGPYPDPGVNNMAGYSAAYGSHMNDAELCATCHTLFTPYLDDNGAIAGEFPEQTPYIEWKNSDYSEDGTTCQGCHMPSTDIPLDISTTGGTLLRTPFWFHYFVGANKFMLNLLKQNVDLLALSASEAHFDSTIARTERHLNSKINLFSSSVIEGSILNTDITIENNAGHKVPTGIPLRRMWINLSVKDSNNVVIFESGNWDANGEIAGLDLGYEPHHTSISNSDEVQIYEAIMKDVNDSVTYTLLRASSYIKDNRLPPQGFVKSHSSYDTVSIVGLADIDPNFNFDSAEGSGTDLTTYHVNINPEDTYYVDVKLCYQTTTPRFINHLFSMTTPEITLFQSLYNAESKAPTILDSLSYVINPPGSSINNSNTVFNKNHNFVSNYPNPFNNSTRIIYNIGVGNSGNVSLKIFNTKGENILQKQISSSNTFNKAFSGSFIFEGKNYGNGVYYIKIFAGKTEIASSKILFIK